MSIAEILDDTSEVAILVGIGAAVLDGSKRKTAQMDQQVGKRTAHGEHSGKGRMSTLIDNDRAESYPRIFGSLIT
jgi:hypothetical protein